MLPIEQMAKASCIKANCVLLEIRGKYYYSEEFGRFIQIEKSEYEGILNFPYLANFTTASRKHLAWQAAKRKGTTLTVAEALTPSASGTGSTLVPSVGQNVSF